MISSVMSPGCMRMVSFQPISLSSGLRIGPVNCGVPLYEPTLNFLRPITCALVRCMWIGWVSPVRLKTRQISVEPAKGVSVASSM